MKNLMTLCQAAAPWITNLLFGFISVNVLYWKSWVHPIRTTGLTGIGMHSMWTRIRLRVVVLAKRMLHPYSVWPANCKSKMAPSVDHIKCVTTDQLDWVLFIWENRFHIWDMMVTITCASYIQTSVLIILISETRMTR